MEEGERVGGLAGGDGGGDVTLWGPGESERYLSTPGVTGSERLLLASRYKPHAAAAAVAAVAAAGGGVHALEGRAAAAAEPLVTAGEPLDFRTDSAASQLSAGGGVSRFAAEGGVGHLASEAASAALSATPDLIDESDVQSPDHIPDMQTPDLMPDSSTPPQPQHLPVASLQDYGGTIRSGST